MNLTDEERTTLIHAKAEMVRAHASAMMGAAEPFDEVAWREIKDHADRVLQMLAKAKATRAIEVAA